MTPELRPCVDADGNEYPVRQIGNRLWCCKNLHSLKFSNSESIPLISSAEEWENAGSKRLPACCWYNSDSEGMFRFGLLYNWFAVCDPRGLAPLGWRVAGLNDWNDLTQSQGGWNIAGRKLKIRTGWNFPGTGNNVSGFGAIPGGGRGSRGSFLDLGDYGNWWCSEESGKSEACFFYMTFVDSTVKIQKDGFKSSGLSVRCVRDL
ncbi:MAG: fibrobacter succinogenes major paralogous domain-containing protein [Cyclobacteriaceae bacterium]